MSGKNIVVALLVGSMVATGSLADSIGSVTKLYKLTGSLTTGYAGDVKSGLPKTAHIAVDEAGNAYILWYWTKSGQKFMSEPMEFSSDTYGDNSELYWWDIDLWQDAEEEITLTPNEDQTAYGELLLAGKGGGDGSLPGSMSGSYYNEAYDNDGEEYLGYGYGTCSAIVYKTLTGESDNAWDAINGVAFKLMMSGYSIPENGTEVYLEVP